MLPLPKLVPVCALCVVSCSDGDREQDAHRRPERTPESRDAGGPRRPAEPRQDSPPPSTQTGPTADAAPDAPVDGGFVDSAAAYDAARSDGALEPDAPGYRFDVRVHARDTRMDPPTLASVLDEAQLIWASQARVCFEFHTVLHDAELSRGFDVWYVPESADLPDINGFIQGRRIQVRDQPRLAPASTPVMYPAARTTAHELGHGLGLEHYMEPHDLSESLMASKQAGYRLHAFEIDIARRAARTLGDEVSPDYRCAPVRNEAPAER